MKKTLRGFVLASLSIIALQAQNIVGSWQGVLKAGPNDLRIVIQVTMGADDKPKAVLHSIDQKATLPASSFTRTDSNVKMTVAALGGTYEGKISADGNSITGTWTQGAPMPLNLVRATAETAWAIPEPPPPPARMAANANPAFEVATIKPSDPNRPGKVFTVRGQDVVTINTTVNDLITMAYNLHAKQLTGGPAWMDSDKYDLTGRPDTPGQPNVDQIKIMLQKVLAERFQFKFHREKKELSVYAVTVLKTGPKFQKSERDPNSLPGLFFGPPPVSLRVANGTMEQFAGVLQTSVLDRPVVDQTGLKEKYDFIVRFMPDPGQMLGMGGPPPPPADGTDAPPDLFTAVQQQLGLKLESTKAPVDSLAIDRIEKPSAN